MHRDGHEIPVEVGAWALDDGEGFSAFVHDITERVHAQATLEHQALHDALTGLPTRALFADRLDLAIASSERDRTRFAVLVLDLDGFKAANDRNNAYARQLGAELVALVEEALP